MDFADFFEIGADWRFANFFLAERNPVFWLKNINSALLSVNVPNIPSGCIPSGCYLGKNVFIHESVKLPPTCVICGPAYIDEGTEIRPYAYIRENVIIGKHCVVGNSCELKNSILLDNVQVPHFNYVGDSIMGNFSHLGAGAILSNLRLDQKEITIHYSGERIKTGMKKIGAIVGDHVQIACNAVINPGTVIPRHTAVFNKAAISKIPGH